MTTTGVIVLSVVLVAGIFILALRSQRKKSASSDNFRALSILLMNAERRLAVLNPRVGRGQPLEPEEQDWLDEQVAARLVTADPSYWALPNLPYDAFDGTRGEGVLSYLELGGSHGALETKVEGYEAAKMQRMVADIGVPKTQAQIARWYNAHSMNPKERIPHDPVPVGQTTYHGAVKGLDPAIVLLYEMNDA